MTYAQSLTLEGFVRHAEHYGTDEVFETALDNNLPLTQLAQLALRLQNLDPRWKLTTESQQLFVRALADSTHYPMSRIAQIAGCNVSTARNWVAEGCDICDGCYETALRRASKARFEDLKGIVRGWRRTA